jgi:AraC-like DNA-binding protein
MHTETTENTSPRIHPEHVDVKPRNPMREQSDITPRTLSDRVRLLVEQELDLSATSAARKLGMSTRSFSGALQREGTSFTTISCAQHRRVALHYVGHTDLPLADVAHRLGFAYVGAFYRAFKRWTGRTPSAYRTAAMTGSRALLADLEVCQNTDPALVVGSQENDAPRR